MRHTKNENLSLTERCAGAVLASVFACGTTIAIPWMLALKFPGKFMIAFPLLKVFASLVFYLWVSFVGAAALLIGFVYGGYAVLDIFNLIWRSGESHDPELIEAAQNLRIFIPMTIVITFVLLVLRRL
jgi:hypothetical protein